MLYTLSCIAAFILLMAIINFINISISKASSRMKEIGVRKVLGGMKKQLVLQFLTESVLLVFFSTIVALIIYQFMRPYLSNVLGKEIPTLIQLSFLYIFCTDSINAYNWFTCRYLSCIGFIIFKIC